jgi:hypothetical protein
MTDRTDRPVLLILDYPGRREEARIAELGLAGRGFDARSLLTAPFVRELTAREYAARLAGRVGPLNQPVTAVLAYCMAAPIAQQLAASLSAGREPVPMILFDGEPATPDAVEEQYGTTVKQFAEQLGADAVPAIDPSTFTADLLSGDPAQCVERMRRSLVQMGVSALSDGEEDAETAETAEDMADFYMDWLVHLVAAHNASWPAWDGDVYHIMSRTHGYTENWPGARSMKSTRVDSIRPELLRQPETGRLVESYVEQIVGRGGP